MAWDEWFVPFFKTIDDNADVIKAVIILIAIGTLTECGLIIQHLRELMRDYI